MTDEAVIITGLFIVEVVFYPSGVDSSSLITFYWESLTWVIKVGGGLIMGVGLKILSATSAFWPFLKFFDADF